MYISSITSIFFIPLSSLILFKDKVDANKFSSIFAIGTGVVRTSFFSSLTVTLVKKFKLSKLENGIGLKITFFFSSLYSSEVIFKKVNYISKFGLRLF